MTQLDLPQVSLQRYVELLKRRRWQVVPVSLLGLLLGGLVAFFIPRYYVAETLLHYTKAPGDPDPRATEDPFAFVVAYAQQTIPLAVGATMKKLGWPEAAATDLYQLIQNERQVQGRIAVIDSNAGRTRGYAQIRVTYRDRDGMRAAEFVNNLVITWTDQRLKQLRDSAEAVRTKANEAYNRATAQYQQLARELAWLEREHDIDPRLEPALQRAQQAARDAEQRKLEEDVTARTAALAGFEAEAARLEEALALEPQLVPASSLTLDPSASNSEEAKQLMAELVAARLNLERVLGPAHPSRRARERQVAEITRQLRQLQGLGDDENADGEVPNPKRRELQQALQQVRTKAEAATAELAALRERLLQSRERHQRLVAAYEEHGNKRQYLEEARVQKEEANKAVIAANAVLSELSVSKPIEVVRTAAPPPAPTEPNILMVALIGCVLGLGLAVGLVLLLDVLQGTFKTVDDVERGLGIPVLGGMSFLETVEQRQRVSRGRRRATVVAAAFVVLVVIVVTVYYLDPVRLPPMVRDLLALVLGG